MSRQRGISLIGAIFSTIILGVCILLVFKVIPAYVEYAAVKRAITELASQPNPTEYSIRQGFNSQMAVSDIKSINGQGLVVVPRANTFYIGAIYQREVHLIANVSLLFRFDTHAGMPLQ